MLLFYNFKKIKVFLIILGISLFNFIQIAHSRTLTWDAAVNLASENLEIKSAQSTVSASKYNIRESYGEFLPKITIGANRTKERSFVNNTAPYYERNHSYSGKASLNLFNGFGTIANIKSAKASYNESSANEKIQSSSVRYDLRIAFFNVYTNLEKIKLYEKVLKRREQNKKLVEIKYKAGTEAKWNVQLNTAELEKAKYDLKQAQIELSDSKKELARILNLDELKIDSIELPKNSLDSDVKINFQDITLNHPEMLKLKHQLNKSDADKILARSVFLPSIDLSYTRSKLIYDEHPNSSYERSDNRKWEITASWNIFNGFSDFHKVQKVNAANEAIVYEKENLHNTIQTNLSTYLHALEAARDKLPIVKSLRESMEARLSTVSTQYRSGLKTYLDWEQAENQLLEAELSELTAEKNALTNLASWEKTLGKTLEDI